ncbi:MAG: serine/threonine-protein kinase [Planctomycetota bacterium]
MQIGPSNWKLIEQLFDEVKELPADQWDLALSTRSDVAPEIRTEVLELLRDTPGDFLASPAEYEVAAINHTDAPRVEDSVPDSIADYRIERELGRGGMGVVYLARQPGTGRNVALKVLHPTRADSEAVRRFEREIHVLSQLSHPAIARIFDADVWWTPWGPQPFFVMEAIDGMPLAEVISESKLNANCRFELLVGIVEAVAFAHRNGIIHRDLTPRNILVTKSLTPKLIDFGIALAEDTTRITRSGTPGTLRYMSPEQKNHNAPPDTRSDVYSLGVIGAELLGRADGGHGSMRDLRAILDRCVAPAEGRYGSAGELLQDLRRYQDHEPVLARHGGLLYQANLLIRRHRVAALLVAVIVVAIGSASFAWLWGARGERELLVGALTERSLSEQSVRTLADLGLLDDALVLFEATFRDTNAALQPEVALQRGLQWVRALRESGHLAAANAVCLQLLEVTGAQDAELWQVRIQAAQVAGLVDLGQLYEADRLLTWMSTEPRFSKLPKVEQLEVRGLRAAYQHGLGHAFQAAQALEAICEEAGAVLGPDAPQVLSQSLTLARASRSLGNVPRTKEVLVGIVERLSRTNGAEHWSTLLASAELGYLQALNLREESEAGRALLETALARSVAIYGESSSTAVEIRELWAEFLVRRDRFDEARPQFEFCADYYAGRFGNHDPRALRLRLSIVSYVFRQDRARGLAAYDLLLSHCKQHIPKHSVRWDVQHHYARRLTSMRDYARARPLLEEAVPHLRHHYGVVGGPAADAQTALAELCDVSGQWEAALDAYLYVMKNTRYRRALQAYHRYDVARMLIHLQRLDEAEAFMVEADDLAQDAAVANVFKVRFLGTRALWRVARNEREQARINVDTALTLVPECTKSDQRDRRYFRALSQLIIELWPVEAATQRLDRMQQQLARQYGEESQSALAALPSLLACYQQLGRTEDAAAVGARLRRNPVLD